MAFTSISLQEVLDNRTCDVCISMHGREYEVAHAQEKKQAFLAKERTALDARDIIPFPSVKEIMNMQETDIMDLRGPQPPFHPGCRGRVVPK